MSSSLVVSLVSKVPSVLSGVVLSSAPAHADENSAWESYLQELFEEQGKKVLDSKDFQDMSLASKVSVQLQLTDQTVRPKDRIVRKSEKDGFYTALDVGCVWLERALAGK